MVKRQCAVSSSGRIKHPVCHYRVTIGNFCGTTHTAIVRRFYSHIDQNSFDHERCGVAGAGPAACGQNNVDNDTGRYRR